MITARGDTACRVKGMPPKETKPSRAFSLGRNDNIGATVTVFWCCAIGYYDFCHGI